MGSYINICLTFIRDPVTVDATRYIHVNVDAAWEFKLFVPAWMSSGVALSSAEP